ncbi:hypothetical protein KTI25_12805 [Acinetobacter ursingii]|nr:hypothetical protein [Acinetobacter ursingii]MCU4507424.1 hypothetical protein [Acinetobacter ursingii]
MIGLFLFFRSIILKIALVLLVILSLIGLSYLVYISYKMLRRVQQQEAQEKLPIQSVQKDHLRSPQNKQTK